MLYFLKIAAFENQNGSNTPQIRSKFKLFYLLNTHRSTRIRRITLVLGQQRQRKRMNLAIAGNYLLTRNPVPSAIEIRYFSSGLQ